MAQSMGYLLAASGPPLIGLLRDSSGGWGLLLALCLALTLPLIAVRHHRQARACPACFIRPRWASATRRVDLRRRPVAQA